MANQHRRKVNYPGNMKFISKIIVLSVFASFVAGCFPLEASVSFAAMLPTGSATPTYGFSQDNSESTATPFQPIPPTDIITPTDTPIPTETPLPTITPTPTDTPTITPTLAPTEFTLEGYEDVESPEGQMNILLIGVDRRPGQKQYRTDTLILVTINSKNNTANITSFPRDMWIEIPGYGMDRINTAYVYGKMELLAQTFKHNFGVKIDHYIMINFKNFKSIVSGLEPLDVKVSESVSDYRAGKYVTVPKGMVTMDADDALWYVRTRKSTNDFARNRRQQEILSAIFHKLLSLEALRYAPELFDFYKNNVETDLKWIDIVPWIPFGIRFVNSPKINQFYIGPQMVYNSITAGGAMVLVPYMDKVMKVIHESQNIK